VEIAGARRAEMTAYIKETYFLAKPYKLQSKAKAALILKEVHQQATADLKSR
jgi:hypothetical protein